MPLNVHKAFTDIESLIKSFYDASRPYNLNAIDVALSVAARALAIAVQLHGGYNVQEAKRLVDNLIIDRV